MTGPSPDGWLEALPVVLVALVVLLLPGTIAVRLLGRSWWTSVAAGAPVGVAVLTLGGVLAQLAGLSWTTPTALVVVLALWSIAGLLGLALRGRTRADRAAATPRSWAWAGVGTLVAAALGAAPVVAVTGGPAALPQAPDTIFHLGVIMTMLETGDASTLHATAYTAAPGAAGYYPAAFHVVAATVALLSGTSAAVAATTVALVTAAVVWPLGVLALARELLGERPVVLLTAPVAAISLTPFPTWLLGYGVLWPNLLGQALVAGTLAVLVGPVLRDRSVVAVPVVLAATAGVVLAHPNGLVALLVLAGVALLARAAAVVRSERPVRTRVVTAAASLVVLAVLAAGWLVATRASASMRASNPKGPEMSWADALVDVLFGAARGLQPQWVTGALVVVGAVAVLRRGRPWWLPVAWLGCGALYVAVAAVDSPLTRLVTWPWYNNSPRLAALVVLPAAVLLVAALAAAHDLLWRVVSRLRGGDREALDDPAPAHGDPGRPAAAPGNSHSSGPVAVGTVVLFVVATLGAGLPARAAVLGAAFHPPARNSWVTTEELDALRRVGTDLPADAVVAANPYRGGQYLYVVAARRLLFPTEKVRAGSPELVLLGRSLDEAGKDAAVCSALRRLGVEWAITGGEVSSGARSVVTAYRGVDGVGESDSWVPVRTEGPYTLHRLVSCLDG